MATLPSVNFLGLEFLQADTNQTLEWVLQSAKKQTFSYLATPNVDHIVQIDSSADADVGRAFHEADFLVCDSRILALLARISGLQLQVTPGSDLTRELLASVSPGTRLAVIGGNDALSTALASRYPHLEWESHYPPMGVRSNPMARQAIAEFICKSRATIFLFAIGAPQSEMTCREIAEQAEARGTALCVGASLEFLTGTKKRAPRWMQGLALEWLFRLLSEPRRLWRRYLVLGPRVLMIWWRWHREH